MRRPARYSIIKYVPDLARGEERNIGILLWTEHDYRLEIDADAVRRVIYESGHVADDAIPVLVAALQRKLEPFSAQKIEQLIEEEQGMHYFFTESRFTTLDGSGPEAMTSTLTRLMTRLVRPRRRSFPGSDLLNQVERKLRTLINQNRVAKDYPFHKSRTGTVRVVHFFANSSTNVAMDVLRLAVRRRDEFQRRIDAEAFKIDDILGVNRLRFVVLCEFSQQPGYSQWQTNAVRILTSVGAEVVRDIDEAVRILGG